MAVLQIIFGISSGHLSLWLCFGRRLLLKVLRADQQAIVSMPSEEDVDDFIEAIYGCCCWDESNSISLHALASTKCK
jgi:hypothetical protein